MIKFSMFKSRVFCRYITYFLLVFMAPMLLMGSLLYIKNVDILQEETYDAQISAVLQLRKEMDYEASRYRTVATVISNDPTVQALIKLSRDDMTFQDALGLKSVAKLLQNNYSANSAIFAISLYLNKSEYYIDHLRATYLPEVDNSQFILYGDEDTYVSLLGQQTRGMWWLSPKRNVLWFIQTVPSIYHSDQGTLMVGMSMAYVKEIFASEKEGVQNLLVGADGMVLFSVSDESNGQDISKFTGDYGSIQGKNNTVYYAKSQITGYYYISLLANAVLYAKLADVRNLMLLLIGVSTLAGLVLIYHLTLKAYKPIRKLSDLACETGDGSDELGRIRAALLSAADDRSEHQTIVLREQQRIGDEALRKRLMSQNGLKAYASGTGKAVDTLSRQYFCLARIIFVDYPDTGTQHNAMSAEMITNCREAFAELSRQRFTTLDFLDGPEVMLLFAIDTEANVPAIRALMEQELQFVRDNYVVDCQIGISRAHRIEDSFRLMLKLLMEESEYALHNLRNSESGIRVDTALNNNNMMYFLAEQTYHHIIHACTEGNTDKISELQEIFNCQIADLAKVAQEQEVIEGDSREMVLKQSIIEIVNNNYTDCNLNVSAIAYMLGRNADAISRSFKQTTLIGLLDYIHHVRIKAAKQMLLGEPTQSLANVAQSVGYASIDSFIRAFKRIEGTTPGKYRDQNAH